MNPASPQPSDATLQKQREEIRRSLFRAHTAVVIIVLVVFCLALVAIVASVNSDHHARAATDAAGKLWEAATIQARAGRFSGEIGWRRSTLDAIAAASHIRPSLGLRNEAIAALAMADLQDDGEFYRTPPGSTDHTFDADLTYCAFTVSNRWIRIVRVADKKELVEFDAPRSGYYTLRFSPDAHYLGARLEDGFLLIWDLRTGSTVRREQPKSNIQTRAALEFTPDSHQVMVGESDGFVHRLHLASAGEAPALAAGGQPTQIRFSPDGKTLAVVLGSEIRLWDTEAGRAGRRWVHPGDVQSLAWSANGTQLAVGCPDNRIFLWSVDSDLPELLPGHNNLINHVVFSPAGDFLASTSYDGTTRLWEASSGRLWLTTQRGFARQFSRDGRRLAYSRSGLGFGIWSVIPATGYRTLKISLGADKRLWSVNFSPDERWLAVVKSEGVDLFNLSQEKVPEFTPLNTARFAAFDPSGKSLVIGTGTEIIIRPFEAPPPSAVSGDSPPQPGSAVLGTARRIELPKGSAVESGTLSADGTEAVFRFNSRNAILVDLANPDRTVRFENYPNMGKPAISRDKKWIATGTFHGWGTRIWDATTGKPVKDLGGRHANVAFSNDGRWLVNAAPDSFDFFRTTDWQLSHQVPRETASELPGLAVFPRTGKSVALTKSHRLLQLVDPDSGLELASLNPPDPRVIASADMSGDSGLLAAGTSDGIIQLWDLGAVRRKLGEIGLDWSLPAEEWRSPLVARTRFSAAFAGSNQLVVAILLGVTITVALSFLSLRHHRRLTQAYLRIDALASERSRELVQAQAIALHSQKMKALGTLAAGIAHDFNNLLSVIRMANQLTAERTAGNSDAQENVRLVEKAVSQGKQVVRSMLGYSREPGAREKYSLAELTEGTVSLLNQQFLSGIQLTLDLDHETPRVTGVKNRLEQILLNLIVNAAEAMNGKGRLRIGVEVSHGIRPDSLLRPRSAAQYVDIIVADSGSGISPEHRDRIFEPFFTTKAVGALPGTGLGLSMVYGIAQEEGLGIGLETAPGQGSTFRITVPV